MSKNILPNIHWIVADAESLPFPDETFDGVVSGYLMRNVSNQKIALNEQFRVLHNNAKVVSLDTTPPTRNMFYPFILAYFQIAIPLIGKIFAGDIQAYSYLPRSTSNHTPANVLAEAFRKSGFDSISYFKMMLGTIAIHFGEKHD
jgi:demethylmenaquinone methyltransferase/2-methoxy-6-polyprenyl-1,4-benzoquinol methylase